MLGRWRLLYDSHHFRCKCHRLVALIKPLCPPVLFGKNQNGLKKTTGQTQPITNTKPYQTIQHPLFLSGLVNPPFFSHSVNYSYIWVAIHNDVETIPGRTSGWLKFHFLRGVVQPTVIFHGQTRYDIFGENIFSDETADFFVNVAFIPGKPFFIWVGEIFCVNKIYCR